MSNDKSEKSRQPASSPGAKTTGIIAFAAAVALAGIDGRLAILPLLGFVLLCAAAPFFPRFGFFVPVISRGRSGKRAVALTFDDGPDPDTTPELLRLLAAHGVQATFFVTGARANAHPDLVREILARGHDIGNHSYHHDPLLMFRGRRALAEEIFRTQRTLNRLGVHPFAFRPPAGITGPRLGPVLRDADLYTLNFSRRAFDHGNRRIENLSKKILDRIRPDDIVLLHDTCPHPKRLIPVWLREIERILAGITTRGLTVLPVSEIIGRPVMAAAPGDLTDRNAPDRIPERASGK